jgi:hypothetical protein
VHVRRGEEGGGVVTFKIFLERFQARLSTQHLSQDWHKIQAHLSA